MSSSFTRSKRRTSLRTDRCPNRRWSWCSSEYVKWQCATVSSVRFNSIYRWPYLRTIGTIFLPYTRTFYRLSSLTPILSISWMQYKNGVFLRTMWNVIGLSGVSTVTIPLVIIDSFSKRIRWSLTTVRSSRSDVLVLCNAWSYSSPAVDIPAAPVSGIMP
jgi:hypothetical protein